MWSAVSSFKFIGPLQFVQGSETIVEGSISHAADPWDLAGDVIRASTAGVCVSLWIFLHESGRSI